MNSAARWVKPGAVLLAMYGASIGRLGVAKVPLTTNQAIAFTEPSEISPGYLFWYLSARKHDLVNLGQGAAQKNISLEIIRDYPFILPPLAEQTRIVEEIERYITRLDAGRDLLKKVQNSLKTYRAAVLKAACNGSSKWVTLKDILSEDLANGKSVPTLINGFPVLRLTAISGGSIKLQKRKNGSWTQRDAEAFLVKQGDFFVARGSGSLPLVGRGGLLEQEPDAVAFPDTMIRIRVDSTRYDPRYLRIVWDSPLIRQQIEKTARTTAGIFKISQKDLLEIAIPFLPIDLQRTAAMVAEQHLSLISDIEITLELS